MSAAIYRIFPGYHPRGGCRAAVHCYAPRISCRRGRFHFGELHDQVGCTYADISNRHFHFMFGSSRALAGFGSCRFGALCVAAWHGRVARPVFKVTVKMHVDQIRPNKIGRIRIRFVRD